MSRPLNRGIWYNRMTGAPYGARAILDEIAVIELHPNTLEDIGQEKLISRKAFDKTYCRHDKLTKPE